MNRYIAFCKVIELGSFTRAADTLGYTQSGISQMIRSLESELSLTLLVRSRTGVQLTPEGEELLPYFQKTVNANRELISKAAELRGLKSGEVRIGTFSSVSTHWLPKLIKEFGLLYPDIRFTLHQGDYTTIPQWIHSGMVDFGFLNPAAASGLKTVPVAQDPLLAVLPEDHPLASLTSVPLSALAAEPFLLIEEGAVSEPLSAFASQGLTPDVRFRIHDDYTILSMVEQGLGISILPEMVLERTDYRFVAIPTSPPVLRTISIAYRNKAALPIAARFFIDYLLAHVPVGNLPHSLGSSEAASD